MTTAIHTLSTGTWSIVGGVAAAAAVVALGSISLRPPAAPGMERTSWAAPAGRPIRLAFRQSGVGRLRNFGVVYGGDGRPSTSKLTAFAWTVLLVGAVTGLLLHHVLDGADLSTLGLNGMGADYAVLLGVPAVAAAATKKAVQTGMSSGRIQKVRASAVGNVARGGFTTNDDGQGDLIDIQYLGFNFALILFVATSTLMNGVLPPLPATVLSLTSASAATYVANKALTSNRATIESAVQAVTATKTVVIRVRGHNLLVPSAPLDDPTTAPGTALTAAQLGRFIDVTGAEVTGVTWSGPEFLEVTLAAPAPAGAELTVQTGAGSIVRYELGTHTPPDDNGGVVGGESSATSLVMTEALTQPEPAQTPEIAKKQNGARASRRGGTNALAGQPAVKADANGQHAE